MSDCPAPAPLNNAEKDKRSLAQGPFWSEGLWDSRALTYPRALLAASSGFSLVLLLGRDWRQLQCLKSRPSPPLHPLLEYFIENLPVEYQMLVDLALKMRSSHLCGGQQLWLAWIHSSRFKEWPCKNSIKTSILKPQASSTSPPLIHMLVAKQEDF